MGQSPAKINLVQSCGTNFTNFVVNLLKIGLHFIVIKVSISVHKNDCLSNYLSGRLQPPGLQTCAYANVMHITVQKYTDPSRKLENVDQQRPLPLSQVDYDQQLAVVPVQNTFVLS